MFKTASSNHQRLSSMADNKAHLLITVNAIILSAVISLILRKLGEQPFLLWPTFLLIVVSLVTIIFAILATRPHLFSGRFTTEQLESKETNLLFYGNFFKIDRDTYRAAMMRLIEDREMFYTVLIHDVYGQGIALAKKYGLLRIAFIFFIYGLVASVLAYAGVTLLHLKSLALNSIPQVSAP